MSEGLGFFLSDGQEQSVSRRAGRELSFKDTPGFFPEVRAGSSVVKFPLISTTRDDGIRLQMLFNNPLFSDITLRSSDGRSFHGHRLILASIPYFEGLFRSGMRETTNECTTITFPDIDGSALEMILMILYNYDRPYDLNDYLSLYVHSDRLASEFLRNLAYRNIRSNIDTSAQRDIFRDLLEYPDPFFDVDLGYRLMKDYYNDGFKNALLDLADEKFKYVMLKLTPYISRNGIYQCPEGIDRSHDYQDFLLLLNYWLYCEFTTHEICCNSVRRKLPLYRKLISAYLTVQAVSQFVMILEQTDERFLPSKELYKHGPYNVQDYHMTFSMTPGLGYPIHWNLAIKIKQSPRIMYI